MIYGRRFPRSVVVPSNLGDINNVVVDSGSFLLSFCGKDDTLKSITRPMLWLRQTSNVSFIPDERARPHIEPCFLKPRNQALNLTGLRISWTYTPEVVEAGYITKEVDGGLFATNSE
jgi:hypothetical protein